MRGLTRSRAISRALIGLAALGAACITCDPVLYAQAATKKTFLTAVVKRSERFINPDPSVANGRFVWQAAPLLLLIEYAYDTSSPTTQAKIPVEPSYDIDATFTPSATLRDIREMLKSLLADKFAVRVHTESRTMPFFKLVAEVGGHKLQPTASRGPGVAGGAMPGSSALRVGPRRLVGSNVTVPQIARALAESLDRPVVDATGITGTFDVEIVETATPSASVRAFMEAVPRQLGLKFEQATGKVDVLVVDGFKMP